MSVHIEPLTHQVNASSAVGGAGFDPAPSIDVAMSSLNGQATVRVLPDSGADVSVAGERIFYGSTRTICFLRTSHPVR